MTVLFSATGGLAPRQSTHVAAFLVAWLIALCALPVCSTENDDVYTTRRNLMIRSQLTARDISDSLVLQAMAEIPRHEFVPPSLKDMAYQDRALPIGEDQTISQPYIVAFMTQALDLEPGDKVLEIGTGSGYQAAVLSRLVEHVFTIEIIPSLGDSASQLLQRQGYDNITVRIGDGYVGWPSEAPFDAIMVTAAPDHVPQALVDQLAENGHLVLPVGDRYQELIRLTKRDGKVRTESLLPVRFVPMTGQAQQ
ncbi:MAG: protein-L-isoaspartate(D-aspartate) O-methyltransferase [Candidatus Latescibacteria bacterium]|jgi:protein-L-isoaspartate(D-aspartate) O-methyltransferase|nr:protein-L-isoaspartate(D-aspartate) O-methyltransferase [Candidatus Latescibacterota bacterium]|tara:strand:+ start:66 stop:821 length:756 start_codon:yes stop_codon:yes gene_type:complete